jgi:AraC family transcriptional regulator
MMKTIADRTIECRLLPVLSSRNQGWGNILVEQFQHAAGEGNTYYNHEHSICLSLSSRPVGMLQTQGGKTQTGTYIKGDFCITPASTPFFARWESDDRFLQIRLAADFVRNIASETVSTDADRLELIPQFKLRDPQMAAIAQMFLTELQPENSGSRLYVESLANVLAVHLIRKYVATQLQIPLYAGGLSQHQLSQVLDYFHDHLHQDIKLADLATLLNMSQFHFNHLFKQSIGTTPYQYLLQQRIERAKQWLKQSDRSIMDIAFLCGFNSHSHLTKQFRQITGITPKAYRLDR